MNVTSRTRLRRRAQTDEKFGPEDDRASRNHGYGVGPQQRRTAALAMLEKHAIPFASSGILDWKPVVFVFNVASKKEPMLSVCLSQCVSLSVLRHHLSLSLGSY